MTSERWQRVSRIAADAMELDGEPRARYLDAACGDDAGLRAEVERILGAHDGFDSLLDGTTTTPARPISVQRASSMPVTPAAGEPRIRTRASDAAAGEVRLPAELVERAARRVGALAMLFSVGFVLAYGVREVAVHLVGRSPYLQSHHTPGQLMVAGFVLLGLTVYALASRRSLPADRLVNVGLVFEVIGSLGIALVSYSGMWELEGSAWGISWLCVWIMIFPLVIPAAPRAAALAAFAAAAMGPLAILIWAATRQLTFPPPHVVLAAMAPNFVAAGLAWFGARHVYRIGLELREARRLGRYRLVSPLGRGGMGEVWIAQHDLLARPAALKLVRPELLGKGSASRDAIDRFEREAQSTAALSSPHTVRLYDFGLTDDGLFYYVMELLEGMDLESLVRKAGPLPPARVVYLLRQACESLAEAHERELIHRDIKPSNLFVCRQGLERDFLKLLDFGIVKPSTDRADAERAAKDRLVLEGTPSFMAPEAAALGTANPRTDLYSLGCVGYWLLTGRPVFEGEQLVTVMLRHQQERPRPPSQVSGLAIPAALDEAVLACLEKDPAARPASASAFAARLGEVPGPAWDQEQARAWWREYEARTADARGAAPPAGPAREIVTPGGGVSRHTR